MKIVVLDGYALNPGDLSWERIQAIGETVIYDRTPEHLVTERSKGADIILTNKTPLRAAFFDEMPELKYIGVLATGYNVVDIEEAVKRNILVTNIPAYGTKAVAQMVFALLLELCHHVQRHSDAVYTGEWSKSKDFCFWKYPLVELAGKTMGIIGLGRIGEQVAKIANAMDMKVIAYNATRKEQPRLQHFKWVELDELYSESDVISLHCPLKKNTEGIINIQSLMKMKKTAFFINTSRGPLVVEQDLADALNSGIIAGAGLDVLAIEPPSQENPLLKARNCIITPHIAWAAKEARIRIMETAADNLQAFLAGAPQNVVQK